ncbi:MC135L [Molluscum contagiosum virus subtype 1]|uniref:DNA-directed RNA polymerase 35 kDa subunit n=4 Tax=Molluscum contagiosum virus TaxID=10279 RepID=Q98301_MCV1|nr:MC135L [Molluscum contagiosum virus subtype 1]AZT86260.1 MC135L [Molluscum contagiosum virus]AAC55263.1 MC135L [Molluscum contagiosum virus subtype 1]AQY16884.1 MC135 [Molluscum contagiosum virus subtype 1]AQY17063.1 MC135 [Molluscum contagiosum virus subtype 1]AQY17242.1 MC135 [Molluscum contagiosum virus subtype 1]
MYREEKTLRIDLPPSVASFIKHGFRHHVRWPTLALGVVLANTTTAINEEWLTAVESMPTRKVFHAFVEPVLEGTLHMCVHLKKTQSEGDAYVSMHDFDYYVVRDDGTLSKLKKPKELRETLLHSFLEYRLKNTKSIELVAFSSGTQIREELLTHLAGVLDIEVFTREHANVKVTFPEEPRSTCPFGVIAPRGQLRIFFEAYPWVDTHQHLHAVLRLLERKLVADVRSSQILVTPELDFEGGVSKYDPASRMLLVRDMVTMSIVNFFGARAQLDTYHDFDMRVVDTERFLSALAEAFATLRALV